MRHIRVCVLFVGSCGPLLAQATWNMGAPWTDLATVFAMAAPGDVVRLNGLELAAAPLGKGLTVLGPGRIRAAAPGNGATAVTVPAGQQAHFVEVDFVRLVPLLFVGTQSVTVTGAGAATFEQCTFTGGQPSAVVADGTVLLRRCTLDGASQSGSTAPSAGLTVNGGLCSVVDCTLRGSDAFLVFNSGPASVLAAAPGVHVQGGVLHASHTRIEGGSGLGPTLFSNPAAGTAGAVVTLGSALLANCDIDGGASPGTLPGATALAGNASTQHARTTLTGGLGSSSGAASTGGVVHRPELLALRASARFALGQATYVTVDCGTAPGPVGVLVGFDPIANTHPLVLGPFLGSPAQLSTVLVALPPAFATLTAVIHVPSVAALVGLGVHAQAFQFDGVTIYASAPVAGVVH